MQKKQTTWAVIGGGNGGQSLAAHLALLGFPVRLYDIASATIESIRSRGGIEINGAVSGFGKLQSATTDIAEAIEGANIIMVVTPAVAHREIAIHCASHLSDGQIIFIHPGATGGALEFKKILLDLKIDKTVTIAESNSLLYACRIQQPGFATVFAIKKDLIVAALPATETKRVVESLNTAFPQIHAGSNVMETSLSNPNAMMHPAPTLLNTSRIESQNEWLYYWDGITPSIGAFVEAMDKERLAVARGFGLKIPSLLQWYKIAYGVEAKTLSATVKKNSAYAQVTGQNTLFTRYLLEDIPMGLVPMVSLGKMLGIDVLRMETVVRFAELLIERDLTSSGRTLENLGLSGMSVSQIHGFLESGRRS